MKRRKKRLQKYKRSAVIYLRKLYPKANLKYKMLKICKIKKRNF